MFDFWLNIHVNYSLSLAEDDFAVNSCTISLAMKLCETTFQRAWYSLADFCLKSFTILSGHTSHIWSTFSRVNKKSFLWRLEKKKKSHEPKWHNLGPKSSRHFLTRTPNKPQMKVKLYSKQKQTKSINSDGPLSNSERFENPALIMFNPESC